jgi:outer membrane autotransporter protein
MAYLGYAPGAWFANAAVVYGWDKYTGSRHVVFPGVDNTALSDYSGRQFTGYGTTGYHFYVGDGQTIITPMATVQYTHLTTHAYTETNGAAIDLNVNAQKYNFVQSGLGAKIARDISLSGSQLARPEVHANWLHSFGNETMRNTSTFTSGGPAFTTAGLRPSRDTFDAGAGITFANSGAWSVEGVYDYQWRSDRYKAHQAMINFVARL